MLKPVWDTYLLHYCQTPLGEDAIFYYKPGEIDVILIRPDLAGNNLILAYLMTYLHASVSQRKRATGGRVEVRESCTLEDLKLYQEPDFVVDGLEDSLEPHVKIVTFKPAVKKRNY